MAGEINTGNTIPTKSPLFEQMEKLGGNAEKTKEIFSKALEVLSGTNLRVSNTNTTTDGTTEKKTSGATSAPSLDNPDEAKAREANLEKLIAYLQLDNEERQAEMAKDRIEINKDSFAKEHKERGEKIQKSLDDIAKAEKSRKASKIFGWLMAALAVVVAVVACVATGGIAVGAVVGALVAIGLQTANELGAMDKLTEAVAELFEKCGMSKEAAQIAAAVFVTVAIIAASIASGAGASALASKLGIAGKALFSTSEAVKSIAEMTKNIMSVVSRFVQIGSVAAGATGAYLGYQAGMSQADVTETEKFLAALKQRMEESQEELEAILQALQNGISQIAALIASATDTSDEIASKIGQMA